MGFASDEQRRIVMAKLNRTQGHTRGKALRSNSRVPRNRTGRRPKIAVSPRNWIELAKAEIETGDILSTAKDWQPACYHYQQGAEIAVDGLRAHARAKGLIVEGYNDIHNIRSLLEGLPSEYVISQEFIGAAGRLTRYFYAGRRYGPEVYADSGKPVKHSIIQYNADQTAGVRKIATNIISFCEAKLSEE